MYRYRIISKSYGIERYIDDLKVWNDVVNNFENSNRTIEDLELQEQFYNPENIDKTQLAKWEVIAQYNNR